MYSDLHFYIDLDGEKFIDSHESYTKELLVLIDFAKLHKANIYCSKKQIEFLKNLYEGESWNENFRQSPANYLARLIDSVIQLNEADSVFEVCFAKKKTSFQHIENNALSSIKKNNKAVLLSLTEQNRTRNLLAIKSSTEFWKVEFRVCINLEELYNWIIEETSEQRNFNKSDKHGENGKGHWKDASPLLNSKEEAQKMLKKAIPVFRAKDEIRLFYFDENHSTYIEFFYEGNNPQKQWHGFHLEEKVWKRVPKEVKEMLKIIIEYDN